MEVLIMFCVCALSLLIPFALAKEDYNESKDNAYYYYKD
jgi:hypothetical protein